MNFKFVMRRIIRRRILSLSRAYRDFILFSLFLGLIITFAWMLYFYWLYRETFYLVYAFVFGLLSMLVGIARFVFVVEFWRALVESWRKRRRKNS